MRIETESYRKLWRFWGLTFGEGVNVTTEKIRNIVLFLVVQSPE